MASVLIGMKMLTENIHTLGQPDRQEIVHDLQETVRRLYGLLGNLLTVAAATRVHGISAATDRVTAAGDAKYRALYRECRIKNDCAPAYRDRAAHCVCGCQHGRYDHPQPAVECVEIHASAGRGDNFGQRERHAVEVAVTDTGVGMTAAALNNLFRLDVRYNQRGTAGEQGAGSA